MASIIPLLRKNKFAYPLGALLSPQLAMSVKLGKKIIWMRTLMASSQRACIIKGFCRLFGGEYVVFYSTRLVQLRRENRVDQTLKRRVQICTFDVQPTFVRP